MSPEPKFYYSFQFKYIYRYRDLSKSTSSAGTHYTMKLILTRSPNLRAPHVSTFRIGFAGENEDIEEPLTVILAKASIAKQLKLKAHWESTKAHHGTWRHGTKATGEIHYMYFGSILHSVCNSHYQDYYISSRGFGSHKPLFATVTGWMVDPDYMFVWCWVTLPWGNEIPSWPVSMLDGKQTRTSRLCMRSIIHTCSYPRFIMHEKIWKVFSKASFIVSSYQATHLVIKPLILEKWLAIHNESQLPKG